MQAVLDLSVLDFAEIAVNFQHKLAEIVGLFVHAQIAVQFRLLHHFPDLHLQSRQLGGIQRLALIMFVHQLLQFGDVAVGISRGHWRYQMVNDGGVSAPFRLRAFAGVVDDERVEQRNIVQRNFRVARLRHTDAFARQPFQRAMLADVDHRIGPEYIPQPAIIGDVMVGWRQVGVVINGNGVFAKAARGLQPDEYIPHRYPGNGQPIADAINIAGRIAPSILQFGLDRCRKAGVPLRVIPPFHMAGCQAQLFLSKRIRIVAAPLNNTLHQFVAVGGNIVNLIAGVLQCVQDVDGGGRRVQADGVADARVFGGIVAQNNGDALVGVALAAQNGVAGGQPGQVVHPVGQRYIALHSGGGKAAAVGQRFLFERHRHGNDASVKLRERYIHRSVYGAKAQRTLRPFCAAAGADDALDDWHIQLIQQFLRPSGGHRGAAAALLMVQIAHGQTHRIDNAVHARDSGGVNHIFG